MSDEEQSKSKAEKPEKAKVKPDEKKESLKASSSAKATEDKQKATESTETKKEIKASPKLDKIIKEIEKLSVLELADLVKALEDNFGVSAAVSMVPAAPASASAAASDAAAEEKSEFDVILSAIGTNKIAAIKAVREIKTDIGLKEAKDLVEAAPKEVLKGVDKKTAEEAKKKLEAAGCQVELK